MKENLSAGRLEFLRDLAVRHPDSVNLEGETVLALITRLEQAEQDRVKLRNRLDAMRRQRDGYQNQLRKAQTNQGENNE